MENSNNPQEVRNELNQQYCVPAALHPVPLSSNERSYATNYQTNQNQTFPLTHINQQEHYYKPVMPPQYKLNPPVANVNITDLNSPSHPVVSPNVNISSSNIPMFDNSLGSNAKNASSSKISSVDSLLNIYASSSRNSVNNVLNSNLTTVDNSLNGSTANNNLQVESRKKITTSTAKNLKVGELKLELEARGLSTIGLKKVLLARLLTELKKTVSETERYDFTNHSNLFPKYPTRLTILPNEILVRIFEFCNEDLEALLKFAAINKRLRLLTFSSPSLWIDLYLSPKFDLKFFQNMVKDSIHECVRTKSFKLFDFEKSKDITAEAVLYLLKTFPSLENLLFDDCPNLFLEDLLRFLKESTLQGLNLSQVYFKDCHKIKSVDGYNAFSNNQTRQEAGCLKIYEELQLEFEKISKIGSNIDFSPIVCACKQRLASEWEIEEEELEREKCVDCKSKLCFECNGNPDNYCVRK
ncbi:hypothetical protein HK099_004493 [Clydaea vesicula]|uniref:F-box domain-containing protein n=1 Tax=Clydaea vesicula TaxID=447962 RepID=A0AAD5XY69_9FUNG|nr:hypothetical protein HK099_004493 [Clydaea vesicula]